MALDQRHSSGRPGAFLALPCLRFAETVDTAGHGLDRRDQPRSLGSESRGWLGVKIQKIDEDTAASLGLAEPKGALLTEVITPGPAAEAGLKNGDATLSVNGNAVADARDLARQISGFSPNTKADVHIIRGQKEQSIAVKLGKIPKELARIESDEYSPLEPLWIEMKLGLKFALFTDADKVGVVVTGVDNSSAQKGIKTSDVILGVGDLPVRNLEDLANGIKETTKLGRRAVLMQASRPWQRYAGSATWCGHSRSIIALLSSPLR